MQRVYFPRHLLLQQQRRSVDGDTHTPRWIVGWRSGAATSSGHSTGADGDLEVCVAACVQAQVRSHNGTTDGRFKRRTCLSSTLISQLLIVTLSLVSAWGCMQPSALSSLLHELSVHPSLQSLWSHTDGAPQLLGVMHATVTTVASHPAHALAQRVGWMELVHDAATQLPVVVPTHPAVCAAQVILFDAPPASDGVCSAARFFAPCSPFERAGSVTVRAPGETALLPGSGPLYLSGSGAAAVASVPSSPLEIALRRINACAPTETLIKHFLRKQNLARPRARLELDSDVLRMHDQLSIPADYSFAAAASSATLLSRACTALVSPFRVVAWLLFRFVLLVCELVVSPLLNLRVLSLSRLVSSLFAPGMARRVHIESVPLWRASYALGAVHAKIEQARRARQLHAGLVRQRTRLLGVATPVSVRAQEELWGGALCHCVDMALGAAVCVLMLALLGCFDGAAVPAQLQPWVPTVLLDSASLRSCFSIPPPLLDLFASISASFESLLSSSAPAGLKLNHRLHEQLGRLLRQGLADHVTLVRQGVEAVAQSPLATLVLHRALLSLSCLCMVNGASLLLSCLLDAVWVASLPLVFLHATVARICSFTCSIFSSLLLLFRGQKRNVLRRGRLDSFPTSANYEHMALGTLGLAITTFLAPTVLVWHAIATSARMLGRDLPVLLLHSARGALHCAPWHLACLWTCDRVDSLLGGGLSGHRIPAGVWMEVMPQPFSSAPLAQVHTTYLLLHPSAAPATTLLFRAATAFRRQLRANPPARVLRTLIWGSDYNGASTPIEQ